MRKLFVAAIISFACQCYGQCPFNATLQLKGSTCFGKDTLVINSANRLASIKWYKNGFLDTTVNATATAYSKNAVTVAGGNGLGNALNQLNSSSVFVQPDGSVYAFGNAFCAIRFPKGSTSATYGTIVAGGNGQGIAANQLQNPRCIFIDKYGYTYISDGSGYRVQRFPPNSSQITNGITVAGGNGFGAAANQIGFAEGIYIDAIGNIYVTDAQNHRIQKFPPGSTSSTNAVTVAGGNGKGNASNQLNSPQSIFVDNSGNLYIADAGNNRIQKFMSGATDGTTVAGGNGFGSAANQLSSPNSVFVDVAGNIFINDYFNHRIQKFLAGSTNSSANGITVAGGLISGSNADQLYYPMAVFVDSVGTIYVSDASNNRIQKFSSTTSTIDSTRIPTAPGNYQAVVTDENGCTVTTNFVTINPVVTPTVVVENSGRPTLACTASNLFGFSAITTNDGGAPSFQWQVNGVNAGTNSRTFTGSFADKDVVTCIMTGSAPCPTQPTTTSSYTIVLGNPSAAKIKNNGSICLGKDTLTISSTNKLASIQWFKDGAIDTTLTAKIIGTGKALTAAGGMGVGAATNQVSAVGVFALPDGSFYEADGLGGSIGGRVTKFPSNSTLGTNGTIVAGNNGTGSATNQLTNPKGMAIDKSGYLYIVDYNTDRILKFPPGSTSASYGTIVAGGNGLGSAASQLNRPWAIAIDGNDNLYVVDATNNRVQKFPLGSTSTTNGITVAGGNGAGSAANQLNTPTSISIDASGNIYIGDYNNYRIQKFPSGSTSATNGVTVAGGNGIGSALNQITPYGTALDKYGNLYVCDLSNYRVLEFPAGSTSATKGVVIMGGNGYGSAANQVSFVDGISVDSSGNVYVADNFNYRIQKSAPILSAIDSNRIPKNTGVYYAVITDTTGCTITTNSITISATVTPTISIGMYGNASVCSATNTINYVAYGTNGGTVPVYQWQVNGVNAGSNSATFTVSVAYKDVVSCSLTSNAACATTSIAISNSDTVIYGKQNIVVLTNKGSVCTGDTLLVNSVTKPNKIQWYKDGVLDTTLQIAKTGYTTNGITVAGGNGRGRANNQFLGATSMALDAMGNIYVDDSYLASRILKFPPNSTSANYGATVVDGLSAVPAIVPLSAYVDVNGNTYMLGASNKGVLKLAPGSSVANILTIAGNGPGTAANQFTAYAFCVDGGGNVYVADFGNQRILKFPPGATSATNGVIVAGGNGTGSAANQLNQPYCVTVDNVGNIYVADYNNNRIQKFPPNSTSATNGVTVAGGNGVGAAANQFSGPIWVSLDSSGNIFVADQLNNRIQKFPANSINATAGVTVAGGNGNGPAANQLAAPCSVVVDAVGNIFVSDYQNLRIQKFLVKNSIIDTTYIPHAAGTYKAVITDSAGCSVTSNAIIIGAKTKPTISILADKQTVCAGNTMGFTATVTNGTTSINYQWQVNGVNVGANNARYTSSALKNGDAVIAIVSGGGGCSGADTSNTIIADIKPLPTVGPATNISIALGQSVALNIPVTGIIATYLWNPAATLSDNTILNPIANPTKTTTYTLKVVSVDSCEASGAIIVTVSSNIYFTSAFTPNGDKKNDVFYVLGGKDGDKIKDFIVFDRWGHKQFQVQNVLPNDPSVGWNGTHNGTLQQSGSYVYSITISSANGTEEVYKGTVLLVR